MKYLKYFENNNVDTYILQRENRLISFMPDDVFDYLDIFYPYNNIKGIYNVNAVEFLKEILLNKIISFMEQGEDAKYYNYAKVLKVGFYKYKDIYIKVLTNKDDEWKLINPGSIVVVHDYDAEDKPLHKEVRFKKDSKKYNI